jgi:hypothetical protein
MDKHQTSIDQLYDEFAARGVLDDEDGYLDKSAKEQILRARLDEFDTDIAEAYDETSEKRRDHLTHSALLRCALEGGDEAVLAFMAARNMKLSITPKARRTRAINSMPKTRTNAENVRERNRERSEYMVAAEDARSLDETLWNIKESGMLGEMQHGALRLLFGTISLPAGANPRAAAQLQLSAIRTLRTLIAAFDLSESKRTVEGEYIMQRFINRGRDGYVTLDSLATELAADSTQRRNIPYGSDITQNRRMIETYVSEALDVIYRDEES